MPTIHRVETITYDGVKYRRYPDSPNWAEKSYFTPGRADRDRGYRRLHEEIWKAEHGDIPAGSHIHHIDLDPLNNSIENLQCCTADEHRQIHSDALHADEARMAAGRARMDHARKFASEWHGSEDGRAWHREHSKRIAANQKERTATCEQCGAEYESKLPRQFCSGRCRSAARRDSGVDDILRSCAWCGTEFSINRYKARAHCSRTCGQRSRRHAD